MAVPNYDFYDPTKKYDPKEIKDWFVGKARTAMGYRRQIKGYTERWRDVPTLGKMYFFVYDAKHKKTLPVWDKFPLIFPIEPYADGVLGLNIHYLSVPQRQAIIGKLMEFRSSKRITERTRIRMTYDLLQSTKSLATIARPCIKRYLFTHVRSKFIEVTANEWDRAAQLPVEAFVYNP